MTHSHRPASGAELKNDYIKAKEKRTIARLVVVITFIAALLAFSISINLLDNLYEFLRFYTRIPIAEVIINVAFILLLLLLFVTFKLWRKTEKELSELENVIDSINPDVLLVVDSDRNVRMCNRMVSRMFGYSVEEMIGQKTDKIYFDRRTDPGQKHEIYYALEREGFHIGVATGRKKDGGTMPLEIISGNIKDREGAVLLVRDISLRKRTEQVLKESETRHRILLNSIKSPIIALGDDISILYCNESFAEILNIEPDQLEWKNLMSIYPQIRRTKFFDGFMRVLQSGESEDLVDKLDGKIMRSRIYPTPWGILAVFEPTQSPFEPSEISEQA
jgi:PAS domain S-box-containing protein